MIPPVYTCPVCFYSFQVRPPSRLQWKDGDLREVYAKPQPHPCPKCGTQTDPPARK
jgi:rubrerythrin